MEEETHNSQKTDRPWLFKKGQSGNPGGRPKGKSLKMYTREMLAAMTEDERQLFLDGIPKIELFRMAEGNPKQDTDITTDGERLDFGVVILPSKNEDSMGTTSETKPSPSQN